MSSSLIHITIFMSIDKIRRLIERYDAGILTATEVEGEIFFKVIEDIVEPLAQGKEVFTIFGGCRSSAHETHEPVVVNVRISCSSSDISITPIEHASSDSKTS